MKVAFTLAAGLLIGLGITAAAMPWRVSRNEIVQAFEHDLGVPGAIAIRGPVTLKILPRPRLQLSDVEARSGAVRLDAPVVKAELDIAALLLGRWRLASASLVAPTVTIATDQLDPLTVGRGLRGATGGLRVAVREGVVRFVSADPGADALFTDIEGAALLPSDGGAADVSGLARWRGANARFAAHLDRLASVATPGGSPLSASLASPVLALAANGALSSESRTFVGHLSLVVPSLGELLASPIHPAPTGAGRIQIAGDVVASPRALSFSDADFRMNRGHFEGTLALRHEAGHTAVEGTLATDLLDVDGLLAQDLNVASLGAALRRPLDAAVRAANIDLRVSASRTRVGKLAFDDAAFAILLRDGRLEFSLDEASLCGGLIKGRAVANLGPGVAAAHADVSARGLDVMALSDALGGEGHVGGQLAAEATLDGVGHSFGEILAGLDGHGQIAIDHGQLAGLSLAHAVKVFGGHLGVQAPPSGQPMVFDAANWGFVVESGVLKLRDAVLKAPGVSMSMSGETHLPDGRVDLAGVAVETDRSGATLPGASRLPFSLKGSWTNSVVLVAHSAPGWPALVLPLVGTPATSR